MSLRDLVLDFLEEIKIVKPKIGMEFCGTNPPSDCIEVRMYNERTGKYLPNPPLLRVSKPYSS